MSRTIIFELDNLDAAWLMGRLDRDIGGIQEQQMELLKDPNVGGTEGQEHPYYKSLNRQATRLGRIASALEASL